MAAHIFGMQSPDLIINVESIRIGADFDHLGSKLAKYCRRDVIGGTVGAVNDQFQATQAGMEGNRTLAKLDVSTFGIFHTCRLANLFRLHHL